jgi:hypothetical protein
VSGGLCLGVKRSGREPEFKISGNIFGLHGAHGENCAWGTIKCLSRSLPTVFFRFEGPYCIHLRFPYFVHLFVFAFLYYKMARVCVKTFQ